MTTIKSDTKIHILDKLGLDIVYLMMKDLSPQDIVNTCSKSKEMKQYCNDEFYKKYLNERFDIIIKPQNYTWFKIISELATFKKDKLPFGKDKLNTISEIISVVAESANFDKFVDLEEQFADIPNEGGWEIDWDTPFEIEVHYIGYIYGKNKIIVVYSVYDEQIDEKMLPEDYKILELDYITKPKLIIKINHMYRLGRIKEGIEEKEIVKVMNEYLIKKYDSMVFVLSKLEQFEGMTYNELFEKYQQQ